LYFAREKSNKGIKKSLQQWRPDSYRVRRDNMKNLPVYTKSQLALRNGQDKPEIWVAYKGIIYDVTRSRLWRNGKHYEHWAGQDLTAELKDAPHDEWVFDNVDAVGKLT
jgi:predicted heme/steroid binding protein